MFPAKGTDSIEYPICLPKRHTMHSLVQIIKGGLRGIGVGVIAFMIIDVELSSMDLASLL